MNRKILLITSSFPYYPGEQFLETEVKYYSDRKDIHLCIMPMGKHKKKRDIDNNIKVDEYLLSIKNNIFTKLLCFIRSMLNKYFYKELFVSRPFSLTKMKSFATSLYGYQRYYSLFDAYFKDKKDLNNTLVYTYWHTEATYALQSLKEKYGYKLVSRIHRFDIYKERRPDSYMPLKHLFTENIDKVFTITETANEYLSKTYGFKSAILELSRLGVDDYAIKTQSSIDGTLSIASCSFLVDVKRVDKIIDVLHSLSKKFQSIKFEWRHIGSGPLEGNLKQYAIEQLSNLDNVRYEFLGHLDNQEVYEFYKNNAIDVFINVSESEGVPVSIMEAMSCHIPIVAPNVGGISDMISNRKNGILLSEKCEVNELVNALSDVEFFKNQEIRENSYKQYLENYSAKKNYTEFLNGLKRLYNENSILS